MHKNTPASSTFAPNIWCVESAYDTEQPALYISVSLGFPVVFSLFVSPVCELYAGAILSRLNDSQDISKENKPSRSLFDKITR